MALPDPEKKDGTLAEQQAEQDKRCKSSASEIVIHQDAESGSSGIVTLTAIGILTTLLIVIYFHSKLDRVEEELNAYKFSMDQYMNQHDDTTYLSISNGHYGTVYTEPGIYTISVNKIKKHGSGSTLILQIGNINAVTVTDFKLKITVTNKSTYMERTYEYDFSRQNIWARRWSYVSVNIPDWTPDQLNDHIKVEFNITRIALN